MKSHEEVKKTESEVLFENICLMTELRNEKSLNECLCIDIKKNSFTPSGLFAFQNNKAAVDFLIDKCGASVNYAVFGAAAGGHIDLMNHILGKGASIHEAVKGAAAGRQIQLVKDLIKAGASLNEAAYGAGLAGDFTLIEYLTNKGASLDFAAEGAAERETNNELVHHLLAKGASLHFVISGAKLGNNTQLIYELKKKLKFEYPGILSHILFPEKTVNENLFLEAKKGNVNHVIDLINSPRNEETNFKFRGQMALQGAAVGGHIKLHKSLCNIFREGKKDLTLVNYAIEFGDLNFINYLISMGKDVYYIINAAAKHPQKHIVDHLIGQACDQQKALNAALQGSAWRGDINDVQHFITLGADKNLALPICVNRGDLALAEHLFTHGVDIKPQEMIELVKYKKITDKNIAELGNIALVKKFLDQSQLSLYQKYKLFKQAKSQLEYKPVGLNPRQKLAYTNSDINNLFSYACQIGNTQIPVASLWLNISTYLHPLELDDALEVKNAVKRDNILNDVKSYYKSTGMFHQTRSKKVRAFLTDCRTAKTDEKLTAVIDRVSPGDGVYSVINKYIPGKKS